MNTKSTRITPRLGQRVKLKANEAEGWPEQYGHYDGVSGRTCYIITLEKQYRDGDDDDGIREVGKTTSRYSDNERRSANPHPRTSAEDAPAGERRRGE